MSVFDPIDATPPSCGRTLSAVQTVLDGDRLAEVLNTDAHAAACPACIARVAEARVLLAALAEPAKPMPVPAGFAAEVLTAVRADRRATRRQRLLLTVGGGLAVAAAMLVGVFVLNAPGQQVVVERSARHTPAPPVNVTAELAKAGDALRASSRQLTEPAAAAPKVIASIAEAMIPPMPAPMGEDAAPVGAAFAELPAAAAAGLEPVAGTTRKAFNRFLQDVGVAARPKS
jgi:hypothetical protein